MFQNLLVNGREKEREKEKDKCVHALNHDREEVEGSRLEKGTAISEVSMSCTAPALSVEVPGCGKLPMT